MLEGVEWIKECWRGQMRNLRREGVEPPTVGSGIQRSTTELSPQVIKPAAEYSTHNRSILYVLQGYVDP